MSNIEYTTDLHKGFKPLPEIPRYCVNLAGDCIDRTNGKRMRLVHGNRGDYYALRLNGKQVGRTPSRMVAAAFPEEVAAARDRRNAEALASISLPDERWKSCAEQCYSAYLVSSEGRAFSLTNGHLSNRGGYFTVPMTDDSGTKKTLLLSRLVCHAFNGAPPEPRMHADHVLQDITDNRAHMLRWLLPIDNQSNDMKLFRGAVKRRAVKAAKNAEQFGSGFLLLI